MSFPASLLRASESFVPVESKRRGYSIIRDGEFVRIRRYSVWSRLAGFGPIYVFERMIEIQDINHDGAVLVSGRVLLGSKQRAFFLVWVCFVLMFELFISAVLIAALTSRVIYPGSVSAGRDLSELVVAALVGLCLLLVAAAVLSLLKVIGRPERNKLINFCKSGFAAQMLAGRA
jgi:hypothetical protein